MKTLINTTYIFIILIILMLATSPNVSAQNVDITNGLVLRNQLDVATAEVRDILFEPAVKRRLENWLTHPIMANYVVDCQFKLRPFFQSENIVGPLCYLLRQPAPRNQLALKVITRYYLEVASALFELQNDPRYAAQDQLKAKTFLKNFIDTQTGGVKNYSAEFSKCVSPAFKVNYPADGSLAFTPYAAMGSCFHATFPKVIAKLPSGNSASLPFFAVNLALEFPNHPGHAITPTGWTGGNKITYHTRNDYSEALAKSLEQEADLMTKLYPLAGRGSVESFDKTTPESVFTSAEGFLPVSQHPVWSQKAGIFPAMIAGLNRAQETVFIDIFFLGGTMGASLAKHVVQLIETKPNLKFLILRDNVNHFGHQDEMRPVFNFLLSYSKKHPDRLVIAESYIEGRRSGLPSFLQDLVTDDFLKKSGIQSHLDLYGRAQSDHSKVMVIDGNTPNATAYVGSKNWTDSSGAVCYDEVAEVSGPAANIVQDDYYFDMKQALLKKMVPGYKGYVELLAKSGWAKAHFASGQAPQKMIVNILKPFDLLNRDEAGVANPTKRIAVTSKGTAVVRTGMNNVDSTRTSAVDQVIQAILMAKKSILIKDQFLFDRNVVTALIRAKSNNPSLDVRVILEPLKVTTPSGLPNLLYLDDMYKVGIQVKAKETLDGHVIAQEYHMKTVAVDGRFVITGSANKDMNTMYGAFREEQLDILDTTATGIHDQLFNKEWNDPKETGPVFTGYDFVVPKNLKGLDGKPLTPDAFIQLVRGIMSIMYDATVY